MKTLTTASRTFPRITTKNKRNRKTIILLVPCKFVKIISQLSQLSNLRLSSKIILPKWLLFPQKKERIIAGSSRNINNISKPLNKELPMVIMIPHTQLSTKQKRAIIAANYSLYKNARKKEKISVLSCKDFI